VPAGKDVVTFDHADVVGAVSDGQRDALAVSLDEVDDERLLKRRHSATDDCLTALRGVQQQQLHLRAQRVHLQLPWQPPSDYAHTVWCRTPVSRFKYM